MTGATVFINISPPCSSTRSLPFLEWLEYEQLREDIGKQIANSLDISPKTVEDFFYDQWV